jgi:hypothetical protein
MTDGIVEMHTSAIFLYRKNSQEPESQEGFCFYIVRTKIENARNTGVFGR